MRRLALTLVLCSGLAATEARAQFANRSITLSTGYLSLGAHSVSGGVPIALGYTHFIDNGFEFMSRLSFMILMHTDPKYLVVGGELSPGIRCLFMQEELRP